MIRISARRTSSVVFLFFYTTMMSTIGVICPSWIFLFGVTLSTILLLSHAGWIPDNSKSSEDFDTTTSHHPETKQSFPRMLHDNGMLHLVLHDLAKELLLELDKQEHELDTTLSERQRDLVVDKVKTFYHRILDHPALTNDRIAFGQMKPDFQKYVPSSSLESQNHNPSKRTGLMDEVCRSHAAWETRATGETRDRRNVQLHGNQFFYVTSCLRSHESCDHISSRYSSQCRERSSWTIAYIWDEDENEYTWDWISINTCCSCAAALI